MVRKTGCAQFHPYAARTEVHFRRLFAVIREYLDALDSGRFNFRPGFGCGMCGAPDVSGQTQQHGQARETLLTMS